LSRVEAAVAFLAVLELRKAGEVSLEQASSFAPIRVTRSGVEQKDQEWIARSA
jgi:chromatin segregation and condensation protein Rec8/ScpA/Scc1 (kleisin family)